jgi:hypothetical protein
MDKKPIPYDYNGEIILIYPGSSFSKNELISRLKEMNFTCVDSNYAKEDLISIYEIATTYEHNIEKIIGKIRKDNQNMKERENLRNQNRREENNNNHFHNIVKRFIFSNEQERNFQVNNESNDSNNNSSNNSSISNSSSLSSRFCKLITKLIGNNKFKLIKFGFYVLLILCIDYFIDYIANRYYLSGFLLRQIRKVLTPKRLLFAFLIYYIGSYIINSLLYYLFGFGIVGLLFLIFKDKIVDFILNP